MAGFAPFPPPAKHARLWKLYLAGSIAVDLGLCLALLLFGGFPLITVIDDVGQYLNARRSTNWPSVPGTISNSGIVPEGTRFGVVANYSYLVEGRPFTGTRIVFSASRPVTVSEAEADKMLAPFGRLRAENEFSAIFDGIIPRTDRRVTVFYDPSAPENSTLRKEYFANPNLWDLWPAIPFSAFFVTILIWSIRSWRRYIGDREYDAPVKSRLPA